MGPFLLLQTYHFADTAYGRVNIPSAILKSCLIIPL